LQFVVIGDLGQDVPDLGQDFRPRQSACRHEDAPVRLQHVNDYQL
jgi:hypothetical protein